ncbi:MAG: hypothetical protein HRT89_09200 [Lentisphaeria bacterium]|nr:hypothetical protein [Lentisphaeria bacterium]
MTFASATLTILKSLNSEIVKQLSKQVKGFGGAVKNITNSIGSGIKSIFKGFRRNKKPKSKEEKE